MLNKPFLIFFLILLSFFDTISFAQEHSLLTKKMQNFIRQVEAESQGMQGGAIAILYRGQVIYKKTFGVQRVYDRSAITPNTLFPLASVSKPVSAIALGLMVEEGLIDFKTKFKLPYLKNQISLIDILSHTTGYRFSGNNLIEKGISRQELLKILKQRKPIHVPGVYYYYSNTIFSLIEEVLNTRYLSLQIAIKKLKTTLRINGIQVLPLEPDMEVAYPHFKSRLKPNLPAKALAFPYCYCKTVPAAAGIFASLDSIIEFFKLSFGYRPDLISKKTLNYLYTPVIANRDVDRRDDPAIKWPCNKSKIASYYGLGWRILKTPESPKNDLIFHGGRILGINSFIGFIPDKELGIIILLNQNSSFPFKNGINFWSEFS